MTKNSIMPESVQRELGSLTEKVNSIHEKTREQTTILLRIDGATQKTNGRVSRLEFWRSAIIWCSGTLWGFLILVAPFAIESMKKAISESVQEQMQKEFQKRDEESKKQLGQAIEEVLKTYQFDYYPNK